MNRAEYAAGRSYLGELAENSGGKVFDALRMKNLGPSLEQVARELASQYSIGYYPANTKQDGKFRKVTVKVKKPDLVAPGHIVNLPALCGGKSGDSRNFADSDRAVKCRRDAVAAACRCPVVTETGRPG